jgi:hypothetical protein
MMLLATLAISVNTSLVENDHTITENGFALGVLGLGQKFLEEAQRLAFDETLIGGAPAQIPEDFTPAGQADLGPEAGEIYPGGFDDLDDFNGFDQVMTIGDTPGIPFRVQACVGYVDPTNPLHTAEPVPGAMPPWTERFASVPTFVKKMEVTVSAHHLPVDVIVNHLFAYQP